MMTELLIQQIQKKQGVTNPKEVAQMLKITEQDSKDILKFGDSVGIFFEPIADEYHLIEPIKQQAFHEFESFIEKFIGNMRRNNFMQVFMVEVQAQKFGDLQPFFYDRNGIFWLWHHDNFCWRITDDIDMLNMIKATVEKDVNNTKLRVEILNALKQRGRLNIPQEIKPSWIQFRDRIIDIETNEEFAATPNFFVTNPILWRIGDGEKTDTLDKLFTEWVGENHIQELYEIMAFSIAPDYFIHRIICLIGAGSNGKSTYLNVLRKFIGNDNITSVSLDALMGSRFAGAKLLKKLCCLMGETNFNTLQKTDFLKKLTGGDMVPGEIKNKNPFDFVNYAKLVMASNSLPMTADKTDGFYRRWKIIDFPNKFPEEKDVLSQIPEKEFENLARKCLTILKGLWAQRIFTNDGNFEDRKRRYEEKSNPIMLYLKENFDTEINSNVLFSEFFDGLRNFLLENGFRELSKPTVAKQIRYEGFDVKHTTINKIKGDFILGIKKRALEEVNPQKILMEKIQ